MKLADCITDAGRVSLQFLAIRGRIPDAKLRDLTANEVNSVRRHLLWEQLGELVLRLNRVGINLEQDEALTFTIPKKNYIFGNLSSLTSKGIREEVRSSQALELKMAANYNRIEVRHWASLTRKLKSTRHKNILLRIVHGDIFSNERLARFGLIEESACNNCEDQIETITHKFLTCTKAREIRQLINRIMPGTWADDLVDIGKVVGLGGDLSRLELSIVSEILTRINAMGGKNYDSKSLTLTALHTIVNCENLNVNEKETIDNLISEI